MTDKPYFTNAEKRADDVLRFLEPNQNLPPTLLGMAHEFAAFARRILTECPRCPQRTMALNRLVEAKDCAVRALLPPVPEGE